MELVDGAVKAPSRLVDRLPVLQSQVDQRHPVPPMARGSETDEQILAAARAMPERLIRWRRRASRAE
jgi:hypothetical protein